MRKRSFAAGAVMAVLCGVQALAAPPAVETDYVETTTVDGDIPLDLSGVWLVIADMQLPQEKMNSVPELLTASRKDGAGLTLHILDVRLPAAIDDAIKAATKKSTRWEPTQKDLGMLSKEWSQLPRPTTRDVKAGDVVYGQVDFTLVTPEHYDARFAARKNALSSVLAESAFALEIVERYKPQTLAPGERVAQVMERRSVYGIRKAGDRMIEGKQATGYLAAGPTAPLPLSFSGPFRMYRLSGAAPVPGKGGKVQRGRPSH